MHLNYPRSMFSSENIYLVTLHMLTSIQMTSLPYKHNTFNIYPKQMAHITTLKTNINYLQTDKTYM